LLEQFSRNCIVVQFATGKSRFLFSEFTTILVALDFVFVHINTRYSKEIRVATAEKSYRFRKFAVKYLW
jgi:hypothetical protein